MWENLAWYNTIYKYLGGNIYWHYIFCPWLSIDSRSEAADRKNLAYDEPIQPYKTILTEIVIYATEWMPF